MKKLLERPVEYGDVRLAPTSELAALAELAGLRDHDHQLETIVRAAHTLRDEDEARDQIARLHSGQATHGELPRRR